MAMIMCPECHKEVSNTSQQCIHCGYYFYAQQYQQPQIVCPKCKGTNISYQREQTATIGGAKHSIFGGDKKGCLYWLLIGWWFWVFKAIFHICTLGLFLIFKKKKVANGTSITASKSINRTMGVCQNCGYSWRV